MVYSVGQGIGLYSSWAILALTQHYLVKISAYITKNENLNFSDYVVLGDDIVIANKEVAIQYMELLQLLGVEVSQPKSIVPAEGHRGIEFASKLFHNGEELSPLPFGLVLEGGTISLFSL